MKFLIIVAIALTCCSCSTTGRLPENSAIAGQSGKGVVMVDVSGLTWKEALQKVGLAAVKAGGKLVADYAVAQLKARLEVPASGK